MIEVSHITKKYGAHTAVSDLSFNIGKGKIYGLLGPNGAGKTTTMNIITGCLAASEGDVRVGGFDIFEDALNAKRLMGYLPEQPPLYPDMTCSEYLKFVARAKGVSRAQIKSRLERAAEKARITDELNKLIRNLSKGYKQRVGIAQALINDPEVIILDEPTVGLDPKQIIEIRGLIRELGKYHTVLLSSHILPEVSALCDEIMIISGGKLVASDTPDRLMRAFAGNSRLSLTLKATSEAARLALASVDGVEALETAPAEDGRVSVLLTERAGADISERVFWACAEGGLPILEMARARTSLEDVFLALTTDEALTGSIEAPANDALEGGSDA